MGKQLIGHSFFRPICTAAVAADKCSVVARDRELFHINSLRQNGVISPCCRVAALHDAALGKFENANTMQSD